MQLSGEEEANGNVRNGSSADGQLGGGRDLLALGTQDPSITVSGVGM